MPLTVWVYLQAPGRLRAAAGDMAWAVRRTFRGRLQGLGIVCGVEVAWRKQQTFDIISECCIGSSGGRARTKIGRKSLGLR